MKRSVVAIKLLGVILVVAACAAPQSAARPGESPAAPVAPQRTLVIAARGEPPTLAARALQTFTGALNAPIPAFNTSLDYIDERGLPQPVLAQALPQLGTDSWRTGPDGRMETTYKLKPGLTWHDGTPLSSEDFAFAWRVYATPALGSATSTPLGQMQEVVAPDPGTVVIRWKVLYPDAGALQNTFQALPRHLLETQFRNLDPAAFTALPFWSSEYVALGAYKLDGWEPGAFIAGQAFDGFALGRAKIDKLRFVFIPDPQTALANILAGEVHYVGTLIFTATEGETLEQRWAQDRGGTVLYSATGFRSTNVQMRPEAADPTELLDVRVRRALAHAIDRASAAEFLSNGHAIATQTITSPQVDYYADIDRVISKYPHDARRAQQLLEGVGLVRGGDGFYARRDGTSWKLGVWSSAGTKNEQEAATYIDSLRQTGINANQNIIAASQLGDPMLRALIPGITLRGGGPGLEGLTSREIARAENRWSGDNRYGWSSTEYDRAFDGWTSTLGRVERIPHVAQMERIVSEQLPIITNYFEATVTAHVANLEGPLPRQTESGPELARLYLWRWRA